MNTVPSWALALAGAFIVATFVEHNPKRGGGLLLIVVLGMLLAAQRKGKV